MSRIVLFTVFSLLIVAISVAIVIKNSVHTILVCTGTFQTQIHLPDEIMTVINDVSFAVFSDDRMLVSLDGVLQTKGATYHISRELWLSYTLISKNQGIIRVVPITMSRSGADNIPDAELNKFTLAIQSGGGIYQVKRINEDIYVVGNAYSPEASCSIS